MILILLFALNLFGYSSCQQAVCTFENDIDYLSSVSLSYGTSATAQICCSQCSITSGCVGFTYVSSSKTCFLKSSISSSSRSSSIGRISGSYKGSTYYPVFTTTPIYTVYPTFTTTLTRVSTTYKTTTTPTKAPHVCTLYNNVFLNGNDLSQVYVPTAQICCNYCGNTPSCKTWSFLKSYGLCMMKNSLPSSGQLSNSTNSISGLLVS